MLKTKNQLSRWLFLLVAFYPGVLAGVGLAFLLLLLLKNLGMEDWVAENTLLVMGGTVLLAYTGFSYLFYRVFEKYYRRFIWSYTDRCLQSPYWNTKILNPAFCGI